MSANGAFKSLLTFDAICARQTELAACVEAQGNVIDVLIGEVQEREMEIAFLMSLIHVVIPTSTIAGANGKLPAIRKPAAQVWNEEGRAKMIAMFQARAKAEQDAQNLSPSADASQESPAPTANGEDHTAPAPVDFTIPGKVTH